MSAWSSKLSKCLSEKKSKSIIRIPLITNKEPVIINQSEEQPKKKVEYIAAIKIPKINIERGLVAPNSYLNNIQYNIAFLKNQKV